MEKDWKKGKRKDDIKRKKVGWIEIKVKKEIRKNR